MQTTAMRTIAHVPIAAAAPPADCACAALAALIPPAQARIITIKMARTQYRTKAISMLMGPAARWRARALLHTLRRKNIKTMNEAIAHSPLNREAPVPAALALARPVREDMKPVTPLSTRLSA